MLLGKQCSGRKNNDLFAAMAGDKGRAHCNFCFTEADITAHKAAEAELKRHRDHLKDIVDVRTAELQDFPGLTQRYERAGRSEPVTTEAARFRGDPETP